MSIFPEVIKEIKHPLYIERIEVWHMQGNPETDMHSAYALDESYIGNIIDAKYLCEERGIKPEKRLETSTVASVGFSEKDGKWYGCSHRALCGFDTRAEAADFAESVS